MSLTPARSGALICLVVAVGYLAVWPVGEYAVEDDWAYMKSLWYLHDAGRLVILDWNPMTLVGHLLWGSLFTKLLGFSFTVAKLSTVVLLAVEALSIAAILRLLSVPEKTILLATLAVVLSPVHFFQSFLYATDVPTLAWTAAAVWMYAKGLVSKAPTRWGWLVAGSACGAMAFGCRQPGILVVAAIAVYIVLFWREGFVGRLRAAGAALGLPVVAVAAHGWWYFTIHGPTTAFHTARADVLDYWSGPGVPARFLATLFFVCMYVALFLLPVILAWRNMPWPSTKKMRAVGAVACLTMLGVFVWQSRTLGPFPYLRNKITHFGFLSPNEIVLGARDVLWTDKVGWTLGGLMLVGACAMIVQLCSLPGARIAARPPSQIAILRLVVLVAVLQLLYVVVAYGIAFDRHLILLMPAAVLLLVGSRGSQAQLRLVSWSVLALPLAAYAICGTHDVQAISRAVFRAGENLVERGIPPEQIDAGYAFDGWHMYETSLRELREGRPYRFRRHDAWWVQSLYQRIQTRYVVSLTPDLQPSRWADEVRPKYRQALKRPRLPGYRVVSTVGYWNYWPFGRREVFVLEDARLSDARPRTGRANIRSKE